VAVEVSEVEDVGSAAEGLAGTGAERGLALLEHGGDGGGAGGEGEDGGEEHFDGVGLLGWFWEFVDVELVLGGRVWKLLWRWKLVDDGQFGRGSALSLYLSSSCQAGVAEHLDIIATVSLRQGYRLELGGASLHGHGRDATRGQDHRHDPGE
jgi:hypothetical protein